MRVAIAYPPLPSGNGVPLLTQNRQFQWFSRPTYIFPVVPATAATMLARAGHEVLFLDGIAAEMTAEDFEAKLAAFAPELVVLETKTPVVKRHWQWIADHPSFKCVLVGDHVTALPEESIATKGVCAVIPGGDWDKYLAKADVGFATKLIYDLDLLAKIEWDYNSRPAGDRKKTDLRYLVGLGYKW